MTDGAAVLGVTRPALSRLLNERADLSAEMAQRIEKAFGVSMDTLMRMQNAYDIASVRSRAGEIDAERYISGTDPPSDMVSGVNDPATGRTSRCSSR